MSPFLTKILNYMARKDYQIYDRPYHYNIVYVEGVNWDGTVNDDRADFFNDRRLVIEFTNDRFEIAGNWAATTEPGRWYTFNPLSPQGAARIAFGQYKAWRIGTHGSGRTAHEALIQVAPITVHRDLNKDGFRTNDKLDTGLFGINQHHGGNAQTIGKWSAGCLVGQSIESHKAFMAIIKQDIRYRMSPSYTFATTVLPGDAL